MSERYTTPEENSLDSMEGVNNKRTSKIESELEISQEQFENIMSKVKNICINGTAYTIIGRNETTSIDINTATRLSNVLEDGVLNLNWLKTRLKGITRDLKPSSFNTVNTRGEVYFNILGESRKSNDQDATFFDDDYFPGSSYDGYNLALIFDLSKYTSEKQKTLENSIEKDEIWSKPEKSRGYTYNGPFRLIRSYVDEDSSEFPKAYDAYGYALSHRIPQRFFEGIVMHPERLSKDKILNIVLSEFKKNDLYLPIYDEFGNLLWPQKLSHEEIVKMKEAEKEQDSD